MSIDVDEVIVWHAGSEISGTIQTATGPPVIAEGYQDNSRLSDHYSGGWIIRMKSYPTRFLTARQERTEVVTRVILVFSDNLRRRFLCYRKLLCNVPIT